MKTSLTRLDVCKPLPNNGQLPTHQRRILGSVQNRVAMVTMSRERFRIGKRRGGRLCPQGKSVLLHRGMGKVLWGQGGGGRQNSMWGLKGRTILALAGRGCPQRLGAMTDCCPGPQLAEAKRGAMRDTLGV